MPGQSALQKTTPIKTLVAAYGPKSLRGDAFVGLAATLKMGVESTGIYTASDSTAAQAGSWFYLLANSLAAQYSTTYTSRLWAWNDTTQQYSRPTVLNSVAGPRRAMTMATGTTRVGRSAAGNNIQSGTIEVVANLNSSSYVGDYFIASKWTIDTQVSWGFRFRATGALEFLVSTDGSTTTTAIDSTTGHGIADGTEAWVKVQYTGNDGAGNRVTKFFKSADGVTWTQIGTTITTVGALVPFAGTSDYTAGVRDASTGALPAGAQFYELWINDGVGGPPVVPPLVHTWGSDIGTGMSTITGTPEINFVLGAQPGAGIGYTRWLTGYLTDPVRLPKLAVDMGQQVAIFSSSHNDYNLHGREHEQQYMKWVNSTLALMPGVQTVALTQNPRTGTGSTDYTGVGHKARRGLLLAWGRSHGLDVIDTYQAFIDDGRDLTTVLISDGVHPTAAGYQVYANRILAEFAAAAARV